MHKLAKTPEARDERMEKIVSLAKRRGFIFQSSEIYGGLNSTYDYGPLGVELKNAIKREWWRAMVQENEEVFGLDAAILMHPRVWEASGHLENFSDPLVDCKKCKSRFRADDLADQSTCPNCGGEFTDVRQFNLMFKTFMGPVEEEANVVYLRPETAQGIYVNFENVRDTMRAKLPFGIAQIGKAFRNEITPGNFTFRTREFEQMEMQYFVRPAEAKRTFDAWKKRRLDWYLALGIREDHLQFHEHTKDELAHYAKEAFDIQYKYPFGWKELAGIHNRGDWDLSRHSQYSGKELKYFDEEAHEKFFPSIIETSDGADRAALVFLLEAYHEETVENEKRVVLQFHPRVAPIQVAVLPLVKNKQPVVDKAREVIESLKPSFRVMYDQVSSIGRRYRRQDEIGTPFCVTIDFETLDDGAVTVRDRDSLKQERIQIKELTTYLKEKV